jgi:hypothetical protein
LVLLMVPKSRHQLLLQAACQHRQQQLSRPAHTYQHSLQHAAGQHLPAVLALCWLGHCSCAAGQHQLHQLVWVLHPLLLLLLCRLLQQTPPQQQHRRCRCAPPDHQQVKAYSVGHQQLLLLLALRLLQRRCKSFPG